MQPAKQAPTWGNMITLRRLEWIVVALLAALVIAAVAYSGLGMEVQPRAVAVPHSDYAYASWIEYRLPLKAAAPASASSYEYGSWVEYRLPVAQPAPSSPVYEYGSWIDYRLPTK
jgi:hypothetical protein